MVALAALNRAWLGPRVTRLPVDRADMVRTLAVLLRTLIAARPATPTERGAPPAPAPDDPALAAARALFVDRGYARPTDTEIAAACGTTRTELARSGGRSALFGRVGAAALDAVAASVDRYGGLPHPCSPADAARWIEEHYAVLDRHGGFLFNQGFTASTDQQFHQQSYASLMRAMWGLGTRLRGRQAVPTDAPDALGLAVLGMITDSWFYARGQGLQVEAGELIGVLATATVDLLGRE
jgi:hypothetical protein